MKGKGKDFGCVKSRKYVGSVWEFNCDCRISLIGVHNSVWAVMMRHKFGNSFFTFCFAFIVLV